MFRNLIVPLDGSQEAERALPYAVRLALRSGARLALARAVPSGEVRVGEPAAGIAMAERDRRIDLVVMATHGRSGIGRAIMGSVAGEVLRTGRAPVVLLGPGAATHSLVQPSQASPVGA